MPWIIKFLVIWSLSNGDTSVSFDGRKQHPGHIQFKMWDGTFAGQPPHRSLDCLQIQ